MQKLYIIDFYLNKKDTGKDMAYYWAETEPEAKEAHTDDLSGGDMDLIDNKEWIKEIENNIISIYTIDEAINKDDILNNLNRYIIKPIKKH